jgi:Uma2 family endonuclease
VSDYWVIDPELESIKVYRAVEGRYVRRHELTLENDDVLTTPLLPGLELPLPRIFNNAQP